MKKYNFIMVALRGIAMGAADVVPGVSGGTIAFITGIYEELLASIKSIDATAVKLFFTGNFKEFFKKINGGFLCALISGIAISVFSLAKLMTWLLAAHPVEIWSFFFGLIIASSILVAFTVERWNCKTVASCIAGAVAAYFITAASPAETPDSYWFIFLAGAIAICAMILPGISGSFILLLLGKYSFLMSAVSSLELSVLGVFAAGAAAGIISFSHLLSWLLKRFRNITVAVLTGFMIGSLNKVWPWKKVLTQYTDRHGEIHALTEQNILPQGNESHIAAAILFCIAGIVLIAVIEFTAKKLKK